MADTVGLTMGELDRLQIVTRIAERRHTRRRAAELLGLSERQVRRLSQAFARAGAVGLASRRRGRPSNRRLTDATREHALALVREHYADFGPTFAHQKLTEEHQLILSVETLRGWMIAAGLWVPRTQRARRSYPPRPRQACVGELVQIDGSEHAWFEDRWPGCTLLVYSEISAESSSATAQRDDRVTAACRCARWCEHFPSGAARARSTARILRARRGRAAYRGRRRVGKRAPDEPRGGRRAHSGRRGAPPPAASRRGTIGAADRRRRRRRGVTGHPTR